MNFTKSQLHTFPLAPLSRVGRNSNWSISILFQVKFIWLLISPVLSSGLTNLFLFLDVSFRALTGMKVISRMMWPKTSAVSWNDQLRAVMKIFASSWYSSDNLGHRYSNILRSAPFNQSALTWFLRILWNILRVCQDPDKRFFTVEPFMGVCGGRFLSNEECVKRLQGGIVMSHNFCPA